MFFFFFFFFLFFFLDFFSFVYSEILVNTIYYNVRDIKILAIFPSWQVKSSTESIYPVITSTTKFTHNPCIKLILSQLPITWYVPLHRTDVATILVTHLYCLTTDVVAEFEGAADIDNADVDVGSVCSFSCCCSTVIHLVTCW